MTNSKLSRWLLVAVAIVALAIALPVVSAHGNETTADEAPTNNATADEWATWMEGHMTEHMGSGSVEWMESHMGVTVDEMAQDMADNDYDNGTYGHNNYDDGMGGQGHC
jgi:Ni/Co efflux regulator RcnB